MRRAITLLAASAFALGLAGCSSSDGGTESETASGGQSSGSTDTNAGGGATITIWTDQNRQPALEEAATSFETATGNTVELVVKNFDDIRADFLSQVSNGKGPDITIGANDWVGELSSNGAVVPIELGDKAADFNEVSTAAFTFDDKVYGVPYAIENIALIRNVDLVADAPTDFNDMVEKGKAAGTKYPFVIQTGDKGDPYTYYPFQSSFGADVFQLNEDGTSTSELTIGNDGGMEFAQFLADNGKNGTGVFETAMTYDIAVDSFAKGEAPMIIGGPWMIDQFEQAGINVAVDPIPAPGSEPAVPFVGVQGFYVSSTSQNQIVASQFLLDYIATQDVQLALYEAGNRLPALTAAAEEAQSDPNIAGFAAAAEGAIPMPSIPEMGSVWTPWGVAEAQIIDGADPTSSWQKMADDITAEINK